MASVNKVFLMGNLTRDPELRYLPSGQAVTNFSIAVNRTYNAQSGEKKEEVSFIRIVVWGRMGEVCNEYLKKGSPVFVEGRLQTRSWEGQDGTKRSTMEVVALNVQFLPRGSRAGAEPAPEVSTDSDTAIFDEPQDMPSAKGAGASSKNSSAGGEEIPF